MVLWGTPSEHLTIRHRTNPQCNRVHLVTIWGMRKDAALPQELVTQWEMQEMQMQMQMQPRTEPACLGSQLPWLPPPTCFCATLSRLPDVGGPLAAAGQKLQENNAWLTRVEVGAQ